MFSDPAPILDVIACSPASGNDEVKEALVRTEPVPGRDVLFLTSAGLPELDRRLATGAHLGAVVHLGRVDLTRQAIRWLLDEREGGRYDADEINRRLGILLADRARWTDWWRRRGVAPVGLTHEALAIDPVSVAATLAETLGLAGPLAIGRPVDDPDDVDHWLAHHCRFTTREGDQRRRRVVELDVAQHRYRLEVDPDDFVGREIVLTGRPYEADLLEHLARHLPSGGRVLDVGAHIGNHTIALAVLGHEVVAVEPNPETRALLEANVHRNGLDGRVTVHGVAAGARPGHGALIVDDDNSGATRLDPGAGSVPIRRIDDLVQDVDLVKLDVEGHELAALEGAHRLLSTRRPTVLAEAHDDDAFRALTGTLALYGYRTDGVSLAADPTFCFTAD